MSERVFLDTNILVYAYDRSNQVKQATAQALLDRGMLTGSVVVSAQVLGEFFITVTRKITQPMSTDEAAGVIRLLQTVPVVAIDLELVDAGIQAHRQWQISYWDGLILAAAARAGCVRVLSGRYFFVKRLFLRR